tara:strand:+ start:31327 stop:32226 length:900 start_codon:yes stop_codon:yes gene_type:complete
MRTYDISLTIFIFFIFTILYILNITSVGAKNVENNWPIYRCNPIIMPFASFFGHNTSKNFTQCIQNMQTNYMGYLMQPLNYNFSVINQLSNNISSSFNNARGFISNLRSMMSNIIQSVFGVFLNILIEFQRVTINIKDLFGKVVGILATFIYTISGSIMTMQSAWKGPPGQLVKKLCFSPDTLIETQNGLVKMKDIMLGDKLKNGTIVRAVLKISNIDEQGNFIESLYKIDNGEKMQDILVSGSHLIYDPKNKNFVEVKQFSESTISSENISEFSCLVTDNHTIPIGNHLFHDWEDITK